MAITGLVAVSRNKAIGRGGALPWHFASDMKFFRQQTIGHACVMGYRTWLSLKKPLRERLNIVLSRRSEIELQENVMQFKEETPVLSLAPYLRGDLFIIGGGQIYQAFLPHIEKWIVTEVPLTIEDADAFMPDNFLEGFTSYDAQELEANLIVRFYERAR